MSAVENKKDWLSVVAGCFATIRTSHKSYNLAGKFARQTGCITASRMPVDFQKVPGLRVEDWAVAR